MSDLLHNPPTVPPNITAAINSELRSIQQTWGEDWAQKNTASDWVHHVIFYVGKACLVPYKSGTFKSGMIKAAAMCCLAVEWCERQGGQLPGRHFDE